VSRVLPVLVLIGITIFTLVTVLQSSRTAVRHLPRWLWFVLVLIIPALGCAAWWIFGRPLTGPDDVPPRPAAPDDDPDFLRGL
jgi:hypothetical protein